MPNNDAGEFYAGPERRKGNMELGAALAEIENLKGAATTLANAVVNTAQRDELEALRRDMKHDASFNLIYMAGVALVVVIVVIISFNIKINNNNKQITRGHEVISCLLGKTEVQRTGDNASVALVTCEQTAR